MKVRHDPVSGDTQIELQVVERRSLNKALRILRSLGSIGFYACREAASLAAESLEQVLAVEDNMDDGEKLPTD